MNKYSKNLLERLSSKAIDLCGESTNEIDRYSWMVVHEHIHGVMPSEYDIREIEEELYLSILELSKKKILN
tara:strand:+ start:399 stop:611 length:213 start_codon:yes stop_codon:yes gene_type:complete